MVSIPITLTDCILGISSHIRSFFFCCAFCSTSYFFLNRNATLLMFQRIQSPKSCWVADAPLLHDARVSSWGSLGNWSSFYGPAESILWPLYFATCALWSHSPDALALWSHSPDALFFSLQSHSPKSLLISSLYTPVTQSGVVVLLLLWSHSPELVVFSVWFCWKTNQ